MPILISVSCVARVHSDSAAGTDCVAAIAARKEATYAALGRTKRLCLTLSHSERDVDDAIDRQPVNASAGWETDPHSMNLSGSPIRVSRVLTSES